MTLITAENGTDPKSLLWNLATTVIFFAPVAVYFNKSSVTEATAACAVFYLLAFLYKPIGWKRPHPYSDDPRNRP